MLIFCLVPPFFPCVEHDHPLQARTLPSTLWQVQERIGLWLYPRQGLQGCGHERSAQDGPRSQETGRLAQHSQHPRRAHFKVIHNHPKVDQRR